MGRSTPGARKQAGEWKPFQNAASACAGAGAERLKAGLLNSFQKILRGRRRDQKGDCAKTTPDSEQPEVKHFLPNVGARLRKGVSCSEKPDVRITMRRGRPFLVGTAERKKRIRHRGKETRRKAFGTADERR